MDYLDPRKEQQHRIILLVGYICIAVGIGIATLILVYQAYGFGLNNKGAVIQNGLTFFSSQPHPANIYIDGVLNKARTNSRVVLPAGIYHVELQRDGYRTWQRTIDLAGGHVEHFDYPFLFPKKLTTKKLQTYTGPPGLATQSPDRRWLLIQQPGVTTSFELWDLKNPTKAPAPLALPANVATKAIGAESWQLGEWAGDNRRVLLEHNHDGKVEFILLDRASPEQSLNLNTALVANPSKLSLRDKKYDQYYLYDSAAATLQSATLAALTPVTILERVLAFHAYGSDTLLYATDADAPAGKVIIKLNIGTTVYTARTLPAGSTYSLDLAKYGNKLYVVAGAGSEHKLYIYRDPIGQLTSLPDHALVPAYVMHVTSPNYVSFSTNAQFIMAENANQFSAYDIENKLGYNYTAPQPLDPPQAHATWMDGDRLAYISGGKLAVFDYDNLNHQTLQTAASQYLPSFAPNYKYVYVLAPAQTAGQFELTQTALLLPADL